MPYMCPHILLHTADLQETAAAESRACDCERHAVTLLCMYPRTPTNSMLQICKCQQQQREVEEEKGAAQQAAAAADEQRLAADTELAHMRAQVLVRCML
jgi:hypothetical protein